MTADVFPLWTTPIWIGQVPTDAIAELDAAWTPEPAADSIDPAATVAAPMPLPGFALELELAAAQLCPNAAVGDLRWKHTIEQWPPGYYNGMRYGEGLLRALVILSSNASRDHPDSGAISLHDPRAGSANVGLPGLPWGRPAKIPPLAGAAAAFPGWLGWSVAPLRAPHRIVVWMAVAEPASVGDNY